jgi:hypothetical protein
MWKGNVSPVMRQKAKGSRPKRNAERRAARRLVLPGFPVSPRPFSKEEIDRYFAGEKIQCLICGKMYRSFNNHLRIHDVTVDEYKEMYGLPWGRGLTGKAANRTRSTVVRRRMKEGWTPPANIEALRKTTNKPRFQPFRAEVSRANVANSPPPEPLPDDLYYKVLDRMMSEDKTMKEVCRDLELPGLTWMRAKRAEDEEKRQLWDDVMEGLSFQAMARAEALIDSSKFREAVGAMRPAADSIIAKKLGVSTMSVNRMRRKYGVK